MTARAFAPLADRRFAVVEAEADATNVAANALLTGLGAMVVSGTIELLRPDPPPPDRPRVSQA